MKNKEKKCVICGKKFIEFGNNAEPIKKGRCCDICNIDVIVERVRILKEGR